MKLKSIYTKDGVLIHEYFVNESDKNKIIAEMGLEESLSDGLGEMITNAGEDKCVFIKTHTSCSLMIDDVLSSKDSLISNLDKEEESSSDINDFRPRTNYKRPYKK